MTAQRSAARRVHMTPGSMLHFNTKDALVLWLSAIAAKQWPNNMPGAALLVLHSACHDASDFGCSTLVNCYMQTWPPDLLLHFCTTLLPTCLQSSLCAAAQQSPPSRSLLVSPPPILPPSSPLLLAACGPAPAPLLLAACALGSVQTGFGCMQKAPCGAYTSSVDRTNC